MRRHTRSVAPTAPPRKALPPLPPTIRADSTADSDSDSDVNLGGEGYATLDQLLTVDEDLRDASLELTPDDAPDELPEDPLEDVSLDEDPVEQAAPSEPVEAPHEPAPVTAPVSTAAAVPVAVPATAPGSASRRLVAAAGFVPAGQSRSARREAASRARAVEKAAREAAAASEAAERAAARAAEDRRDVLPASGVPGPEALRQRLRLRVPPHKATSEVLAGAYPFLAEAGLGSEGVYVGADSYSLSAFCYDPWVLYQRKLITNPNVLIAGAIGSGKSTCAKCLATRSIAFGRKVYVPGDPKGEWTAVAHQVGGQAIVLGGSSTARLNPLDEGPRTERAIGPDGQLLVMDDERWALVVTARRRELLRALAAAAVGRTLHATEATALNAALESARAANTTLLLPQVVSAMFAPDAGVDGSTREQLLDDGREVAHGLNRLVAGDLAGLFDGPSTLTFDPSLPMVSLDLSQIQASDDSIALVQTCAAAWMESAFSDPEGGQRWVIYDEAWRLFRSPALLSRMQSQWKLSRALGIANMAIMHRLSDLDAVGDEGSEARNLALGLLADCSTRIIYAHEPGEADKTGARIGLTSSEISQLQHLDQGEGLWKIRDRSFMVRNLLTPGELEVFRTDARMGAV